MKRFPFLSTSQATMVLRLCVSLFLIIHGVSRIYHGGVVPFGDFLNSQGFMIGLALAWALTIFEIVGGLLLAVGYYVRAITAVFIAEIFMGIVLVHAQHGWFVVGGGLNGVEYSVLLIVCLVVIAAQSSSKKF
ncbi:DoxX family protein [Chryseolinea lacunae]|uniref:DoxX family protein n=1 Tax=Chryseolinea lacunae TaxID=2801331 RepID=A0ABS1KQV2_9BACT|nr:DoxX family protein [Chryseolinea lacunae]MBL0741811.1 DoxX family protein [Chryseolinea lacunae]